MKTLDKKIKGGKKIDRFGSVLFPKPVNPKNKKQVNQWADEMTRYGESIAKTLKKLPQLYKVGSESPYNCRLNN